MEAKNRTNRNGVQAGNEIKPGKFMPDVKFSYDP